MKHDSGILVMPRAGVEASIVLYLPHGRSGDTAINRRYWSAPQGTHREGLDEIREDCRTDVGWAWHIRLSSSAFDD